MYLFTLWAQLLINNLRPENQVSSHTRSRPLKSLTECKLTGISRLRKVSRVSVNDHDNGLTALLIHYSGLGHLVKFDFQGKLLWAINNQLVDTTAGLWKDAADGGGIVRQHSPCSSRRSERRRASSETTSFPSSEQRHRGVATELISGRYRWIQAIRSYWSPRGAMKRLLKKTVQRNTWIYVSVRLPRFTQN
jgi:hypothetical protein